jgi:hypothetical protein
MRKRLQQLFGMFLPVSCVFNTAEDDANKPDLTDDGIQKGPGAGSEPESKKPGPETHELIIDGEKKIVTTEEMRELAQKSAGANAKFESAAELRKQAENGIRIDTLVASLDSGTGTEQDAKELATLLGLDPKDFLDFMSGDSDNDEDPSPSAVQELSPEVVQKALGMSPEEAKQILAHSKNRHIDDARRELKNFSDSAVEKDEIFAKMLTGPNKDDRLEVIKDMVSEDFLGRIERGQQFGAETMTASIQKIRAHLLKFGIPNNPVNPVVLGLGPGGELPTEVQADEPIKRINAFDDGAEDNLVKRYLQKAVHASRNL